MRSSTFVLPLALVCTMSPAALLRAQQTYPRPTPAQQAGIDKDTSRHFGDAPADPGLLAKDLSPALMPAAIDAATRKVADWQLARTTPNFDQIWTSSVLYAGFLATSAQLNDPKYKDAMLIMARGFNWQLRGRQANQDEKFAHLPGADDQALAQTYIELYLLDGKRDPKMIAPLRSDFDAVMPLDTLRADDPRLPWWWCDALFMAPGAWARLYAATGDHRYIDYLNKQWARTYDALWDADEHMYARDATYKTKLEANGKKMFWSRGEGWVMGGLARTLQYLPKDDPHRAFYVANMRELAARLASLIDSDGLLHAGLLDPEFYPLPEISGTALTAYGMAWGVNNGVLDHATYAPVVAKMWRGMLQHVYADGRLGDIQQTGPEPAFYPPSSSFNYGVGGFLLAASEIKIMAQASAAGPVAPDTVANTDPAVYAKLNLPVPANPALPTIWLVGDSTVRNGKDDGAHNQLGWGKPFAAYFDPGKVNVVNRAIGGRSSRTYISEGHWAETLKLVKPGDVILIQFGHNDPGPLDDKDRARGSLPGIGDESREIDNPVRHVHEVVHSYGFYMDQYIREARAKGATPIVLSMVPRKIWKDGHIVRDTGTYAGWAQEVADRDHADFIPLNEITARKYDALGEAAVEPLFGDPHTHTTEAGALMNAESVVAGLKALQHDPVAADFSAKGKSISSFNSR